MATWNKLLLLVLVQCIGSLAELPENRTLLAIPFLFPWKSRCSQRYPPGDTHQYRFFFTSQISYAPTFSEIFTSYKLPSNDKFCDRHPQVLFRFTFSPESYFYERHFLTQDKPCDNLFTMCYQCNNNVQTLVANFSNNPTFSMIAHLFGSNFNHSLAIYPVPPNPPDEDNKLYMYKVLFGPPRHSKLDGIVIEAIYSQTNFTVYNGRGATAVRNGHEHYELNDGTFKLVDQCKTSILWIEPKPVNNCQDTAVSLQHVVIESNKPLKVFTNQAKCESSREFSFYSQLVHEMPSLDKWGRHFILDIQQARIIPEEIKNTLKYDISLLSFQQNTAIEITYYNNAIVVDTKMLQAGNTSLRIQKTAAQVEGLTHVLIRATAPIMVLYTIHSQGPEEVYLSSVVQPVSWFANIQTLAMSRVNGSRQLDCNYHVSVVVPKRNSNPRDIFISDANSFNITESFDSQEGIELLDSGDFKLFYFSPKKAETDTFLVWHRDPMVDIGMTVFAYCPQRHFAYSNGYIADGSPRDLFRLPPPNNPIPVDNRATLAALFLLLILIVPVLGVICYWRWRSSKTFRVRSDEHVLILKEPGKDYGYDVFILFPEEDEDFVQKYIYEPMCRRNYKVLWRGDKSHDLFQAGNDVVSDLATAIQTSRKIIVVCTRHFTEKGAYDREVSFFKDVQKSERQRRLIPLVIEGEYTSQQFGGYNQVRVSCREDLNDSTVAEEMLQRLVDSIGDPIHTSEESLVFV